MSETLFLTAVESSSCRVHPVVLFQILDHFHRRPDGQRRVIGTLLGSSRDGMIEVRSCFPVPHTERDSVQVDQPFHRTMLELHKRISPKEFIVGWYSTGEAINDTALLLHQFFSAECDQQPGPAGSINPIMLQIDTSITKGALNVKAYVCSTFSFTPNATASQFMQIRCLIKMFEAERVGLRAMLRNQKAASISSSVFVDDLDTVQQSLLRLQEQITTSVEFVERVKTGQAKPDNRIGRFLADTLNIIPNINPQMFNRMLSNSVQDVLMVVYLANMARSLTERLQNIA